MICMHRNFKIDEKPVRVYFRRDGYIPLPTENGLIKTNHKRLPKNVFKFDALIEHSNRMP